MIETRDKIVKKKKKRFNPPINGKKMLTHKKKKNTPTHLFKNPDQWITKVGKFLRKTSLDELPQIINILKDEMRQGDSKEISLQS